MNLARTFQQFIVAASSSRRAIMIGMAAIGACVGTQQAGAQTFFRGTVDNFAGGTDPATPSLGQRNYVGPGRWRDYDQAGNDLWHIEHFGDLPCGITAANLIFVLRPATSSLSYNDGFGIDFINPTNTIASPNANRGPEYYIRIGADPGYQSMLVNPWNLSTYPSGMIVNLDLANMPTPATGGTNLIARLNQYGYFNFAVQDDTYIDYITLVVTAGGAPINDSCANAAVLVPGTVTGSTACATPDGTGSCGLSNDTNDVWYVYNASCPGTARIHTCGSGYDTVLNVYQLSGGACPGGLVELPFPFGCNDDAVTGPCPFTTNSLIDFPVLGGQVYYIRVAGFGGDFGTFSLTLVPPPGPGNDDCPNAATITNGSYAFDNRCAMTDGVPSTECWVKADSDITGDLWYTYTATCDGSLTVSTCDGADFDTRIAIYNATDPCSSNAPLACSDDTLGCGGGTTTVSLLVANGQNVRIRLGGYSGSVGTGMLTVSCSTTCPVSGAPFLSKTFYVQGTASGQPMAWCVNIYDVNTDPNTPACSFCDYTVASLDEGDPVNEIVDQLVSSINAYPLGTSQLSASNSGTFTDPNTMIIYSLLKVRIGNSLTSPKDFTLSLGANGQLTCNPVPIQPLSCTFNPMVYEIPTTGLDCNNNGEDDAIDIFVGTSQDLNADGIPDECFTCRCDWNASGSLTSQDFFDFISAFFSNNADFNHDGTTTSQDFFDFLICFLSPPQGC